ncbi:MAG: hypothetical protein U1B80_07755 [Anaerolineaceae bacterium]|nr:hypothetical protein [Anaerolineaceae bacterium]
MKHILPLLLIAMLLAFPYPVRADIAPPASPPGANPEPGSETQVRMVAETVLINVLANAPANSLGRALVTADFTMRNLGSKAESMAARFPISAYDGFDKYPEISNLRVQVDGKTVPTRRIMGEDPYFGSDSVPWAEFNVIFPPGQDVNIRVTYTLEGMGEYPFVSFRYIMTTGAGWKGTIGSADLIVRLPYDANPYNVILDQQIGWSQTTAGATLTGNEVRWHYDDLEPAYEHNLDIALVSPSAWQKVLTEQANIARNPNDGEAWGRLGMVYKAISFLRRELRGDAGGQELYNLSVQAYEKCLALLPDDALWHAGFAELLYWHYIFDTYWTNPGDYTDVIRALEELQRALEINPQTIKALEILDDISYSAPGFVRKDGDQYVFLYLTATPVPPTVFPTVTLVPQDVSPTATASPAVTSVATLQSPAPTAAVPQPQPKLPVCGSALLIPLALFLLIGPRRLR